MKQKISNNPILNRPPSELRPLAEILISWWSRREAEWRANEASEETITKITKKLGGKGVKPNAKVSP